MIGSWLLGPCMRPSSGVGQLKLVQPVSFEAEVFCAHVQNRRIRQYIDVNELITIVNKDYWNLCKFNNINNYVYNQLKFLSYILSLAKNFFECRLYSTFQLHKVYLILKECSLVSYLISNYQLFIFFSALSRVLKEESTLLVVIKTLTQIDLTVLQLRHSGHAVNVEYVSEWIHGLMFSFITTAPNAPRQVHDSKASNSTLTLLCSSPVDS